MDKAGVIRVIIAYLQLNQLIVNLTGIKHEKITYHMQDKNDNLEMKTTKECLEDRQIKRKWVCANHRRSSEDQQIVENLHQFALNLFQVGGFTLNF